MSKNPNYTGGERFNKLSKKDGYRSRAAYKLKQINKTQNLIKQNQNILDIGCAPGSWIQVVKEITKGKANITGVDILPMEKIEGIIFLQKDLLEIKDADLKKEMRKRMTNGEKFYIKDPIQIIKDGEVYLPICVEKE